MRAFPQDGVAHIAVDIILPFSVIAITYGIMMVDKEMHHPMLVWMQRTGTFPTPREWRAPAAS